MWTRTGQWQWRPPEEVEFWVSLAGRADRSAERVGCRRTEKYKGQSFHLPTNQLNRGRWGRLGGRAGACLVLAKFKMLDIHLDLAVSKQLDTGVWRAQETAGLQIFIWGTLTYN